MKKIIFTGGGTLGHVMPNIYLMEELKDYEIFYIGGSGIEKEKLKNKVKYYEIPTTKLIRGKVFKNLNIPFTLVRAINKCKKILKQEKPDVIFSKGGYVSLPVCLSARSLKIPIIAHESDSSFGLANRIILKLCSTMCVNFKTLETSSKIKYTGPIFSKDFENLNKNTSGLNLDENKPTMLVVGGSLGSKIINEKLTKIVDNLLPYINIIHITGKNNLTKKSYKNYNAFEMRNDMPNLYNIADFVLGRSGAGVTAECYYKKLPMLLVPLDNGASRGDQLQNAEYYQYKGVAKILKEQDLNEKTLFEEIKKMSSQYKEMKNFNDFINGKNEVLKLIRKF